MRIALVGAHGTGKTTLATALVAELRSRETSVDVTPEIPRIICRRAEDPEYFRRANNKLLKQLMLLVGQPIYEQSIDSSVCVCDRSILDHWAYTKHLFLDEMEAEEVTEILEFLVVKHMSSYDRLFYVPIEFTVQDDGTREGDSRFQSAIDAEIKGLLSTHDLRHTRINGTVSERLAAVLSEVIV